MAMIEIVAMIIWIAIVVLAWHVIGLDEIIAERLNRFAEHLERLRSGAYHDSVHYSSQLWRLRRGDKKHGN